MNNRYLGQNMNPSIRSVATRHLHSLCPTGVSSWASALLPADQGGGGGERQHHQAHQGGQSRSHAFRLTGQNDLNVPEEFYDFLENMLSMEQRRRMWTTKPSSSSLTSRQGSQFRLHPQCLKCECGLYLEESLDFLETRLFTSWPKRRGGERQQAHWGIGSQTGPRPHLDVF